MTAQKYLGLTRELVRTEKAINDLACYPLDSKFWEAGGAEKLHEDRKSSSTSRSDLFNNMGSTLAVPVTTFTGIARESQDSREPQLNSTEIDQNASSSGGNSAPEGFLDRNEFNLKDAVMESISKAIGLSQPSDTPIYTADTSPTPVPRNWPEKMWLVKIG